MKITEKYRGRNVPFENDRTLWLRSLPAPALVRSATITLTPLTDTEAIAFDRDGTGNWGVKRTPSEEDNATYWAIADLGTRRDISAIIATREVDLGRVTVQVDIGGTWIGIAADGTIQTPGKQPLVLNLPAQQTEGEVSPTILPPVTTEKIKLTAVSDDLGTVNPAGRVTLSGLNIHTLPTNVSIRLEQIAQFATHLGKLTSAVTFPDFANILNAFLVNAKAQDGFYAIPFTFHSDAIAQMDITLEIDYIIVQPVLPPHLPEVTISYDFSTLPNLDSFLSEIALPRNAIPISDRTRATIRGEFPPTRIAWGQIGAESQTIKVLVSPECSLAQPFQCDREIDLTAIDLPLANIEAGLAGLNVSIQADADGKPLGEVLTSAEVKVEKPLPDRSSWGNAKLSVPYRIEKGKTYWLILQSEMGKADWNATPDATEKTFLHCSRDGGFSWHPATVLDSPASPAALFRLRETPDRFKIPVQLQIGEGLGATRRRLDEFAPLGRVEFNFDFADRLGKYLADPAMASPCGTEELLINGSFDRPPHSDATRRVFGFDYGRDRRILSSSENLSRGIDLSVQHFITLSVNGAEPVSSDCVGHEPSRTQPDEIAKKINSAMKRQIAFYGYYLQLLDSIDDIDELPANGENLVILAKIWDGLYYVRFFDINGGMVVDRQFDPDKILSQELKSLPDMEEKIIFIDNQTRPKFVETILGFNPSLLFLKAETQDDRSDTDLAFLDLALLPQMRNTPPQGWKMSTASEGEIWHFKLPTLAFVESKQLIEIDFWSGTVIPLEEKGTPPAEQIVVALKSTENEPTNLSQTVSVSGGCTYQLSCLFFSITATFFDDLLLGKQQSASDSRTERQKKPAVPSWKISWLDNSGQLISSEGADLSDRFVPRFQRDRDQLDPDEANSNPNIPKLEEFETKVVAPPNAVQAQIQFIQLPSGVLVLEEVSFQPTLQTLGNANFRFWKNQSLSQQNPEQGIPIPLEWNVIKGAIDPLVVNSEIIGCLLRGDGAEDAILTQIVAIAGGKHYELQICAYPQNSSHSQTQQAARLELHWLGNGSLATPTIFPLDGISFPRRAWTGTAPDEATQAEIRLIQPKGEGNLVVESVSFSQIDSVSVPLIFLAETPGELTVSDFCVAYDLPELPEWGSTEIHVKSGHIDLGKN